MLNLLTKYANWKTIVPLLLAQLFFTLYLFPKYDQQIEAIAGEKVEILDRKQTYDLAEVTATFTKMQEGGQAIYKKAVLSDMFYPLAYGFFFIFVLAFFLKSLFPTKSKMLYLAFVPGLAMLFDYLENVNTLKLLTKFPTITEDMVNQGAFFTEMKWLFVFICMGMTFGMLLIWGIKRMARAMRGE